MHRAPLLMALALMAPLIGLADDSDKSSQSGGQAIYKTVGPDGKVVFSDKLPPGEKGEEVDLGPTNVQPAYRRPMPTRKLSPADRRDHKDQYAGPINFAIVSPQNNATIPPGQRVIVLQVALEPVPPEGYQFYAVVDGQPWAGSSSGTSLDISALERGSHNVQAVLTDLDGNPLARSQTVTIHVKRPGGRVPDFPAPQAVPAPKAPAAPGLRPPRND